MPDVSQLGCHDVTEEGVATFCGWWKWGQRSSTLVIDGRAQPIDSLHSLISCDRHVSAGKEPECVTCPQCTGEKTVVQREAMRSQGLPGSWYSISSLSPTPSHQGPWEIFEDLGVRQEQLCQTWVTAAALWNSQSDVELIFPIGGFPILAISLRYQGKIAFRSLWEHSSPC